MIQPIVGPVATGEAFFDRKYEVDLIWKKLETSNLYIAAPRRFGKTSIFKMLEDNPRNDFTVLYLDLEGHSTPADFIVALTAKLVEDSTIGNKFKTFIRKLPGSAIKTLKKHIEEVGASVDGISDFKIKLRNEFDTADWKQIGDNLMLAVKGIKEKIVIILDEFPILIKRMHSCDSGNNSSEIELFLYWLRSLRMSKEFNNVKFIIGGSIGIEHVLSITNSVASINDLEKVQIGAFDRETAEEFIKLLFDARKIPYSEKAIAKSLELIDIYIPYFIQILASALEQEVHKKKLSEIGPSDVEETYDKYVLGIECKTYFEHYHQRLGMIYEEHERKAASEMLKHLSINAEMERKDLYTIFLRETEGIKHNTEECFSSLMGDLENDFYIECIPGTNRCRFKTRVLRDFWKKYYGFLS